MILLFIGRFHLIFATFQLFRPLFRMVNRVVVHTPLVIFDEEYQTLYPEDGDNNDRESSIALKLALILPLLKRIDIKGNFFHPFLRLLKYIHHHTIEQIVAVESWACHYADAVDPHVFSIFTLVNNQFKRLLLLAVHFKSRDYVSYHLDNGLGRLLNPNPPGRWTEFHDEVHVHIQGEAHPILLNDWRNFALGRTLVQNHYSYRSSYDPFHSFSCDCHRNTFCSCASFLNQV